MDTERERDRRKRQVTSTFASHILLLAQPGPQRRKEDANADYTSHGASREEVVMHAIPGRWLEIERLVNSEDVGLETRGEDKSREAAVVTDGSTKTTKNV